MAKSIKPCPDCNGPKPSGKGRRYCDDCAIGCVEHVVFKTGCNACQRVRRSKPENKKKQLRSRRKTDYGLTDEQLATLESIQHCEVCGSDRKLCIDHDHETGKVRGVLCDLCNKALGQARDNPKILRGLANYLEER